MFENSGLIGFREFETLEMFENSGLIYFWELTFLKNEKFENVFFGKKRKRWPN